MTTALGDRAGAARRLLLKTAVAFVAAEKLSLIPRRIRHEVYQAFPGLER